MAEPGPPLWDPSPSQADEELHQEVAQRRAVVFQLSFCCRFLNAPKLVAKIKGKAPIWMDFGLSKPPEAQHMLSMGSQRMAGEGRCKEKSCSPGSGPWNIPQSPRGRLSTDFWSSAAIWCRLSTPTPPAGATPTRTQATKCPPRSKVGFDSSIGIPHFALT